MADDLTEVRAALVHVSQEAADLESFAVDLGVKLKETEAERNNLAFEKRTVAAELEKTRMRLAAAEAERDALKAATDRAAEAIRQARRIMACSSRDWSLRADDVWLYALIVGWDCEIPEHADGSHDLIDCSGPNHLESFAERFGWTDGGINKIRAHRQVIAALDHPTDTTGETETP